MSVAIPDPVLRAYTDWERSEAWSYNGVVTVWRLEHATGSVRFLKVKSVASSPRLATEATAMRWAGQHVRVPRVVDAGTEEGVDWLITDQLTGQPAMAWKDDPQYVVPIFARGLRRFHELPVAECPLRLTVADAVEQCRARLAEGLVDLEGLHRVHQGRAPAELLLELERLAPETEDLVVCHGDYCFPNVMIEDGAVTGYLDLGELAVADRWADIAIGMWTTTWNVGPGFEELFAESYGVAVDEPKLAFYRLLYDLIS